LESELEKFEQLSEARISSTLPGFGDVVHADVHSNNDPLEYTKEAEASHE